MPTGLVNPDTEGQTQHDDPGLERVARLERGIPAAPDNQAPSDAIDMSGFEAGLNQTANSEDEADGGENTAASTEQSALDDQPDDMLGRGFTGKDKKKRKISGLRRRTAITIGGITFVLGIGGIAVVSPMITPLHWLHYAQGLHILDESSDETSSLSIAKLYRYYKTRDFNRTRLSFLQNQKHDKFISALAKKGIHIQPRINGRSTNVIQFEIEKVMPELAGKPQVEVDAAIKKQFGKGFQTTLGKNGTVARISMRNASTLGQNKLASFVAKSSGTSSLDTALIKWHMKAYYSIADLFHPSRKVDSKFTKILDKIFPAAAKAKAASKEGKNAWEKFKESEQFKGFARVAGGLLIAQMAVCTVRDTSAKITEIQHEAVVKPGQIYALTTAAYAAQIEADSTDIQDETMSTATESLYKDGKTPMDSNAFKSVTEGKSATQYDSETNAVVEQINNAFSPTSPDKLVTNAVDQIKYKDPTLGDVALCNGPGLVIGAALGIGLLIASIPTTGGTATIAMTAGKNVAITFAFGLALGAALSTGTDYVAKMLAGEMPELANQGVLGGELTVRAYESIVDSSEASVGGVVASNETKGALSNAIAQTRADTVNLQSTYERFVDPKNGNSFVGKLLNNVSPSPKDNLSNVASAFMNIGQSITRLPGSLFAGKNTVYAAADSDLVSSYDAVSAIEDIDTNEEEVAALYDGVQGQFYRDKVLACTGNQVSWDDADGYWDVKNVSQVNTNSIDYRNNCANRDVLNDKNWTKIRASLKFTSTLEHLYCTEINEEDSCTRSGVGGAVTTLSSTTNTADTAGAVGPATLSRAQGSWGGYTNGNIPSSALTSISDITASDGSKVSFEGCETWMSQPYLNPSAAVSVVELNKAYSAAFGKNLKFLSCYRDYNQQKAARAKYGSGAAVAGRSNHGWGLAVDFDDMSSYNLKEYQWLLANAPNYGWVNPKNMQQGGSGPHEPWHWEYARPVSSGGSS